MHPHGLVSLNPAPNTALVTLAAKAAITVDQTHAALTAAFLIKRVRYFVEVEGVTAGEGPLILGIAPGDTNDAEIATAMTTINTVGPEDTTQSLAQNAAWSILRQGTELLQSRSESVNRVGSSGHWHKMPGRGIPVPEGKGFRLFVFNADIAALTTGSLAKGIYEVQGVWLGS